ncbi:induced myeloid leukemia cell differentiation protein Mcl-1b [Trichomycterus rosablanca]|uniref:induced myeloid leukemia cell differentiation protein Mcl-1b n=1 Tax=Trichomycterus rosablanca TaxID=2290929 RepID=UPI002F354AA9
MQKSGLFTMLQGLCLGKSNGDCSNGGSCREKSTPHAPLLNRNSLTLEISPESHRGSDDGSLPTSPDYSSDDSLGADGCFLDHNTRDILSEFFCSGAHSCPQHQKVLLTMRRVVDSLLVKHQFTYKGMLTKISLGRREGDMTLVSSMAKEVFSDGITNWGRIASLLAFGTVVCQYEKENGRGNSASLVADEISSYLLSDQRKWLVKNKAWDGFVEFFHVPDPESTVRSALMAFVTVAGIGASIAFMAR